MTGTYFRCKLFHHFVLVNLVRQLFHTRKPVFQVSWIRRSDLKILTIGLILYTKDNRFCPIHDPASNVWILKLAQAQVEDSGDYECQVSYHEDEEKKLKMSFSVTVLGKANFPKTSVP